MKISAEIRRQIWGNYRRGYDSLKEEELSPVIEATRSLPNPKKNTVSKAKRQLQAAKRRLYKEFPLVKTTYVHYDLPEHASIMTGSCRLAMNCSPDQIVNYCNDPDRYKQTITTFSWKPAESYKATLTEDEKQQLLGFAERLTELMDGDE